MASTVSKLYDYLSADIPPELRRWHVGEEEINGALTLLSRDHASQDPVGRAEAGDSLRCRDARGRTVLLYPGRKLPGAEEAERAALGRGTGETFSCRLGTSEVTLTVEEILRLTPHPVDGALVKLAGIEGVETVEDYRAWYVRETEPKKREDAIFQIALRLFDEVKEHSEFVIDEEEKRAWCELEGREIYEGLIRAGIDPHIPDEGFVLLTDEEALEKVTAEDALPLYMTLVLSRYMSQEDGYVYTREEFEEKMVKPGMTYSEFQWLEMERKYYFSYAVELLEKAAEKFLED